LPSSLLSSTHRSPHVVMGDAHVGASSFAVSTLAVSLLDVSDVDVSDDDASIGLVSEVAASDRVSVVAASGDESAGGDPPSGIELALSSSVAESPAPSSTFTELPQPAIPATPIVTSVIDITNQPPTFERIICAIDDSSARPTRGVAADLDDGTLAPFKSATHAIHDKRRVVRSGTERFLPTPLRSAARRRPCGMIRVTR
jgi:hypothetical protein